MTGLGSAFWIYLQADNQEQRILGCEITGGTAYPVEPEDSRKYLRELEQYGGKMALIGNDIERLFSRLWHGKPLALIIAGFSIIISFGTFYAAGRLSPKTRPDVPGKTES